jgi:hypothetical protein
LPKIWDEWRQAVSLRGAFRAEIAGLLAIAEARKHEALVIGKRVCSVGTVGVLLAASFGLASAEDNVHRQIEYFVETSSGEPISCGMEFTFIFVDQKYSGEKFAGIDGSLTNDFINGISWTPR